MGDREREAGPVPAPAFVLKGKHRKEAAGGGQTLSPDATGPSWGGRRVLAGETLLARPGRPPCHRCHSDKNKAAGEGLRMSPLASRTQSPRCTHPEICRQRPGSAQAGFPPGVGSDRAPLAVGLSSLLSRCFSGCRLLRGRAGGVSKLLHVAAWHSALNTC